MIKGVNKQIVEINYTKDDYVEKAILIINPKKSGLPKALLSEKARSYMNGVLPSVGKLPPRQKKRRLGWILLGIGAGIALIFVTICLL